MNNNNLSRKLSVILHADVVGSTTLVQRNETLAHERMQAVSSRMDNGKIREKVIIRYWI